MNRIELKLKVIELSKTLKRNELYDYIIAKYYASDRIPKGFISVTDIEEVTGLKIKDPVMMNKLLYHWINFLTEEELIQKVINILTVIDCLTPEEQDKIVQQHRIEDDLMMRIFKNLNSESNSAA